MFEILLSNLRKAQAEYDYELANTFDPYRLYYLLRKHRATLEVFQLDAEQMVLELEEADASK